MLSFNFPLLFLSCLIPLISAQSALLDEANPIFIRFNGTLSAHLTPPASLSSQCHDFDIDPVIDSAIYVGVYPDWDPNPFFFHISHGHSEGCSSADCPWEYSDSGSPSIRSKRQFLYTTSDQLTQLDFASTYYVCEKDGRLCGTVEVDPYYVSAQLLDLKKVSVERVPVGNETGYRVQGDEKAWVSNNTVELSFDLGEDHTLYADAPVTTCLEQPDHFVWNATENFNYTISFSNSSASATLFLNSPRGTVLLQFNGSRVDDYSSFHRFAFKQKPNPTFALDTSDAEGPNFMWSNGTKIQRESRDGSATASAAIPTATRTSQASSTCRSSKKVACWERILGFLYIVLYLL